MSHALFARLQKVLKQTVGIQIKCPQETKQSCESNLASSAFDPRDLDRGQTGLVGKLFLRPASR